MEEILFKQISIAFSKVKLETSSLSSVQNPISNMCDALSQNNVFYSLEEAWVHYSERPLHSMAELKKHNTNVEIGTFFEIFCKHWLLNTDTHYKVDECYRFSELSQEMKEKLGLLQKVDLGIDLIGLIHSSIHPHSNKLNKSKTKYIAIQCKFISKPKPNPYRRYNSWTVPWKKLATFQGLVARTGPNEANSWDQHLLMTNCSGVSRNRAIPKDPKAKTVARKTFEATEKGIYYSILEKNNFLQDNKVGNKYESVKGVEPEISNESEKEISLDELRKKRLEKFK